MPRPPLETYLHDHLAGAQFAIGLLEDLSETGIDADLRNFAADLLDEVKQDRAVLESLLPKEDALPAQTKESAAWLLQKAARAKLVVDEPLGAFEAVEVLCLGIQGKLGLWRALATSPEGLARIAEDHLAKLIKQAENQQKRAEAMRIRLGVQAFAAKAV